MSGPNSIPNGDTTVMRGHMNEKFICTAHKDKRGKRMEVDSLRSTCPMDSDKHPCHVLPLRWYLEQRGMLRTGKTKN